MKLVETIDREYRIQSNNARSFRVTIPKKISEKVGIQSGDKLYFNINSSDSKAVIDLYNSERAELVSREVSGPNNLLRVPSPIGCALQLRRKMIRWKLFDDGGSYVIRVLTPYIPLRIPNSWEKLSTVEMSPTQNKDGEHFSIHFEHDVTKNLNWTPDTDIGFLLCEINDQLGLRCSPVRDSTNEIYTTKVSERNKQGTRLRMYIPRSLVRSLNLSNKTIDVSVHKNSCILTEKNPDMS